MEFFLGNSHFNLMDILVLFLVFFLSYTIFYIIVDQAQTNVHFFRRMRKWRDNCLAILYREIRDIRLSGASQEELQTELKKRYDQKSFDFMRSDANSKKERDDRNFIGQVISNMQALQYFSSVPSFGKKEYKKLMDIIDYDENTKNTRNAIMSLLKDKSIKSVDNAMIWLPKLLSKEFVSDPNDPDRKIGRVENTYALFYILLGVYFEEGKTPTEYKKALMVIKKTFPYIDISLAGHSSDWLFVKEKKYSRAQSILNIIEETINQTNTPK